MNQRELFRALSTAWQDSVDAFTGPDAILRRKLDRLPGGYYECSGCGWRFIRSNGTWFGPLWKREGGFWEGPIRRIDTSQALMDEYGDCVDRLTDVAA